MDFRKQVLIIVTIIIIIIIIIMMMMMMMFHLCTGWLVQLFIKMLLPYKDLYINKSNNK